MTKIKRLDHVAIVVDDIENALHFWRDKLGLKLDHIEDVPEQKSQVAFLPLGQSEIELVKPTTNDSGIARFLEKRGSGLHHLCFEVDDIQTKLDQMKVQGVRLINETAMTLDNGTKIAFIHPQSANGVLVELYELP